MKITNKQPKHTFPHKIVANHINPSKLVETQRKRMKMYENMSSV